MFPIAGGVGNAQTLQEQILEARDKVTPALVNVQPITDVYSSGERRSATGVGSGFIFDDDGHVITNYHVAGKAKRLIITLSSKQRVPGVLVGGDPLTDIAVLKLELGEGQEQRRQKDLKSSELHWIGMDIHHYFLSIVLMHSTKQSRHNVYGDCRHVGNTAQIICNRVR